MSILPDLTERWSGWPVSFGNFSETRHNPHRLSNSIDRRADPCAICGEPVWSDRGPWPFLADSWATVCCGCALEHAPELCALIWMDQPEVAAADEADPLF
jgi:hypothetical protein